MDIMQAIQDLLTPALLLLVLSIVLFMVELAAPWVGIFFGSGMVSFLVGVVLLMTNPNAQLSGTLTPTVIAIALAVGGLSAWAMWMGLIAQKAKPIGVEDKLLNQHARVTLAIQPGKTGKVAVYSEVWQAKLVQAEQAAAVGATVRVVGFDADRKNILLVENV